MSITIGTYDFGSYTIRVWDLTHGAFNFVVERWPAAATLELVLTCIEACIALPTKIRTFSFIVFVFSCAGPFRPFSENDVLFHIREFVVGHILYHGL